MSILLRTRHRQEAEHQARVIARIARETGAIFERPHVGKLAGDPMALRGIPAVGRGISGVSPGTRPGGY